MKWRRHEKNSLDQRTEKKHVAVTKTIYQKVGKKIK